MQKRFADDTSSWIRGDGASRAHWVVGKNRFQRKFFAKLGLSLCFMDCFFKDSSRILKCPKDFAELITMLRDQQWNIGHGIPSDHPQWDGRDLQRCVNGHLTYVDLLEKISLKDENRRKIKGRKIKGITKSCGLFETRLGWIERPGSRKTRRLPPV